MNRARPGVSVLGNGTVHASTDAIIEWNEALDAKMRTGKSKSQAVREIVNEQPELHRRFIAEHNRQVGPSSFRGSTL